MSSKTMSQKPWLKQFKRKFIPKNFKITDWARLKPLYQKLEDEPITSTQKLEGWFQKMGELEAVIGQEGSIRYVQMTCDTNSEKKKNAYLDFVKNFQPKVTEWHDKLNKKYYESGFRPKLPQKKIWNFRSGNHNCY